MRHHITPSPASGLSTETQDSLDIDIDLDFGMDTADGSDDADDSGRAAVQANGPAAERMSAEQDVADSVQEVSAHRFDDMPQDGPLNFDDGTDMGHPRGNTQREGGTWQAEGADSGSLGPAAEILSPRNGPSGRGQGR